MPAGGRARVLLAGVFSQILCMGVARFAYTPLLPLMQQQTALDEVGGGWLAAINYLGYLCGALVAASLTSLTLKFRLYRAGLLLAVLSTGAMALTEQWWLWALLRFLAGLSTAASMLLAAGLIMNWLLRHRRRGELGIHFAGVGLGIVFAALAAEIMLGLGLDWRDQWGWLALLGLGLGLPAWRWMPAPAPAAGGSHLADNPPGRFFLGMMLAAYFCAGYGYVVSATFIVAIVDQMPGLQGLGHRVFLVMGLAAVPAVMLWDLVARRTGYLGALALAFALQIGGIVLPALSDGLLPALLGAALYGATFIGCVSLVLTMAGRCYPGHPARLMGKLTLAYGIAQIGAPALTGWLATGAGGYRDALWLAGAVMVLGTLLVLVLKYTDDTAARLDRGELPVAGAGAGLKES
ncbi:YbfB/YjiJ family MFS transporter [Zobellella taiwanensis]|jgi:predicted MFS family arabinose efflux permease|uniref:MFS transporter n=1 Tax=Zobellella taiwanensis TaxID=347535 RepID=A0A2P7RE00_9GAMM|nr:YbfB/YjiJ family MFS transporter [Zobellella taiwanensis]PSJ48430.1 MFS transporter [Zobellella taiwanensis]